MQFSSRLSMAIHTLLVIDYFKNECKVTSDFIAGSVGANPVIIRNILGKLKGAGLVEVAAGRGGTSLLKSPENITLLEVFHAVEADEQLFHIHEHPNPECPIGRQINSILEDRLDNIKKVVERELDKLTLQSLLNEVKE